MTSRRHISRGRKEGCRVKRLQLSLLILMACWSTDTHIHINLHEPYTHLQIWGEWGSFGCMHKNTWLGLAHTCSFTCTHKMCRKWAEEALDVHMKNTSTRVCECILPQTFKWSRINSHSRWMCTQTCVCALTQHEYVFLNIRKRVHSHTRGWHILYSTQTPSHTKHCLWQMLAGILPGRKLFHFFLFSLYFGMPISVHSVAMSPKLFLFSSSSSVHVPFFLSPVLSSWNWSHLCQERLEENRGKRGGH